MRNDILSDSQLQTITVESNSCIISNTCRCPDFIRDTNELKAHERIDFTLNQSFNGCVVNWCGFLVFQQVLKVFSLNRNETIFFRNIFRVQKDFSFNQFVNVKDFSCFRVNCHVCIKINFCWTIVTCFGCTQRGSQQFSIESAAHSHRKGISDLVGWVNQQFNTVIIFNQIG